MENFEKYFNEDFDLQEAILRILKLKKYLIESGKTNLITH